MSENKTRLKDILEAQFSFINENLLKDKLQGKNLNFKDFSALLSSNELEITLKFEVLD